MSTNDLLLLENVYTNMKTLKKKSPHQESNVKGLNEDEQTEMNLGYPRAEITPEPTPNLSPNVSSYDPMEDQELMGKIKSMIAEYSQTKNNSLVGPIMEEMAKLYAPEAKEIVQKLENNPIKTTRGNYGGYMALLSNFTGLHKGAMIFALRDAGAGRGLDDAIRVISGQ